MKISNKKSFALGIFTVLMAVVCIIVFGIRHESRYAAGCILFCALAVINFMKAFMRYGALEAIVEESDERDRYLLMKSSHMCLKIMRYVLTLSTFSTIILYGLLKNVYILTVSITLCSILVVLFLIFLSVNIYLERHE